MWIRNRFAGHSARDAVGCTPPVPRWRVQAAEVEWPLAANTRTITIKYKY